MNFIFLLITILNLVCASDELSKNWLSVYKITDQHPVYQADDVIQRPAGTYQLLFAPHYIDKKGALKKSCLWYRVPDSEKNGELIVTSTEEKCQNWNQSIIWEVSDIRSLSFKHSSNQSSLEYTSIEGKLKKLEFKFLNLSNSKKNDLFENSTPQRAYKGVFFLAPFSDSEKLKGMLPALKDQDCSFTDSSCYRCLYGVIKLNDPEKKQFKCGVDRCGEKNELACLRGFEWSRERTKPSCRLDPRHLYCQQGLRLECEGELGFCR